MLIQSEGKATWLNYHHLYYFMMIANEGGIARAAEKLRLGQPTLSAQLKQFEESLGVQLFDRQHKKLSLTESGRLALDYAQQIFRLGGEMVEALNDRLVPQKIHVQVGALDSIPKSLVLSLARKAYSLGECTLSILEGKGDELIRELANHRIDLFLANFSPSVKGHGVDLYARKVAELPICIYGAAGFRHLRKDFPRSLHHQPVILPTAHSKLRSDLEHYFQLKGLAVQRVAETQDTSLQKLLAADGAGMIAAPEMAVSDLLEKRQLVEIGRLAGVVEDIFLISSKRKIENPISSQLMKGFAIK